MRTKFMIHDLTKEEKRRIKETATYAAHCYNNASGELMEEIRRVFQMIRHRIQNDQTLEEVLGYLEKDAFSYEDM
jgi:hypothetical protein